MYCTKNGMSHICHVVWMLKLTYAGLFIAAGVDKFFNFIADWPTFISPVVQSYIPLDSYKLIQAIGAWEIFLGLLILTCFTRCGARLAALWLLIITGNLLTMGYPFDRAVRDVVMAIGAIALAELSCYKKEAQVSCCKKDSNATSCSPQ